jgi:hypothetical protein
LNVFRPVEKSSRRFLTFPFCRRRRERYLAKKAEIEKAEGCSLADFATGYKKFGFQRTETGILYREWAPGASELWLIGDFSTHIVLLAAWPLFNDDA